MDRRSDDGSGSDLELEARLADLAAIRSFVEERCRALGAAEDAAASASLVVSELCANALEHGTTETSVRVRVLVAIDATRIVVTLIDHAGPFDPRAGLDAPPATVDGTEPRGLGLRIVGRSVDHVDYRRAGARNVVRLSVPRRTTARGHWRAGL